MLTHQITSFTDNYDYVLGVCLANCYFPSLIYKYIYIFNSCHIIFYITALMLLFLSFYFSTFSSLTLGDFFFVWYLNISSFIGHYIKSYLLILVPKICCNFKLCHLAFTIYIYQAWLLVRWNCMHILYSFHFLQFLSIYMLFTIWNGFKHTLLSIIQILHTHQLPVKILKPSLISGFYRTSPNPGLW